MHLIYKKIWTQMTYLMNSRKSSAGRPAKDPDARPFYKQVAFYKRAIEALPPSERKAWREYVDVQNADLKSTVRNYADQNRIASRRSGVTLWSLPNKLKRRNHHRSIARQERQIAIIQVVTDMREAGEKVTAKTVRRKILSLYKELQPITLDTLRKEIAFLKKNGTSLSSIKLFF